MPALLIITLIFKNQWVALLLVDQTILLLIFFAGYWEFFGINFKRIFLAICQVFILYLLYKRFLAGVEPFVNIPLLFIFGLLELFLLNLLIRILISIHYNGAEKVEIAFPFKDGEYLITDGGNSTISRLMNYHFHSPIHRQKKTNWSMLYATDIVMRSKEKMNFLPRENKNYPVFGQSVFCPINGKVVKVVNDIDDNLPYSGNYPYNTGNTVIIKNNRYYFLLGHLKRGSVAVNPGDEVQRNDRIGEAGNSGMSERPHLHMQLMKCNNGDYWKGLGINIQYQGKNLYKNRIIKSQKINTEMINSVK